MKDYSLKINGQNYDVQIDEVNEASTMAHVIVNGVAYDVEIGGVAVSNISKPHVAPVPKTATNTSVTPAPAAARPAAASGSGHSVKCPLPGTIIDIKVSVGSSITAGQTLLVLEAMKMENNIDADRNGVVKSIAVQQGATVMEGDVLIVIE